MKTGFPFPFEGPIFLPNIFLPHLFRALLQLTRIIHGKRDLGRNLLAWWAFGRRLRKHVVLHCIEPMAHMRGLQRPWPTLRE